jgi:hypothetical protein
MNYFDHYHKAQEIWLKHLVDCAHENDIYFSQTEWTAAKESFEYSEQIKILEDGSIKIKWENGCWWADCKHAAFHGQYYCILAAVDKVAWEFPYDLAKRKRGESEQE